MFVSGTSRVSWKFLNLTPLISFPEHTEFDRSSFKMSVKKLKALDDLVKS